MQIKVNEHADRFKPIEISITIESKIEFDTIFNISLLNDSIPKALKEWGEGRLQETAVDILEKMSDTLRPYLK